MDGSTAAGKRPPGLDGFSYDHQEAVLAYGQRRLLAIRMEINTVCNLQCRYCFAQCSKRAPQEAGFDKLQKVVTEAASMKVRSIIITGGGEPLLHSRFKDIISLIHLCGLQTVIFTNAMMITSEMASFLYKNNVSVISKIDSFHPAIQDNLAGFAGAYVGIQAGFCNLVQAGFSRPDDPGTLRLGIGFVANTKNVNEIEELWHFCRRNYVFPYVQLVYPGRVSDVGDLLLSPRQIRDFRRRLYLIDKEHYGYNWASFTPFIGGACFQHFYSLYITIDGDVRPCKYMNFDKHPIFYKNGRYPWNVFERPISEIYDADPFVYTRSISGYPEGRRGSSGYPRYCIGCRRYACRKGIGNDLSP